MVKSFYLSTLIIFLVCWSVAGQSLDSLWAQRNSLYADAKYAEAIVVAQKITVITKSTTDIANYGNALVWEAAIYKQLKKNNEAEESYKQAILVFKNVDDNLQSYAAANNYLGVFYSDNSKIIEAENAYLEALKIYKSYPGDSAVVYQSVLENLVVLYTNSKQPNQIINVYEQQISSLKKLRQPDSLLAAKINILAVAYHNQHQYVKAQNAYNESKLMLKKVVDITNPYYMQVLQNMKVLYEVMEKKDSLILNLEEITEIQLKALGSQSMDYALTANELAIVYEQTGQLQKAKPYYQIALKILKEAGDKPNYFMVLANSSRLFKKLQDISQAISSYLEILAYQKENLPKSLFDYGNTLNNIGVIWLDNNNEKKAIPYFEAAIEAWGNDASFNANKTIVENNLYTAYANLNEDRKLIEIDLKRIEGTKDDQRLAKLNYSLGKSYEIINMPDSAIYFYKKIEQLIQSNPKIEFQDSIKLWNRFSIVYADKGDWRNVITYHLKYLSLLSASKKSDTKEYALQLSKIGVAYHQNNEVNIAMDYYEQSNKLYFKLYGELDAGYIQSLSNIATLQNRMHKFDDAEKIFIKAIELSQKAFAYTSAMHINVLNSLADVYYSQEKYDKAFVLYKKAQDLVVMTNNLELQIACLGKIAKVNAALYKFDLAIKQYQEVLRLRKLRNSTINASDGATLNELGKLFISKSAYKAAEDYFLKAETQIGENKEYADELIIAINGIGSIKKYLGKYDESEAYYKQAITLAAEIFGNASTQLGAAQNNIAVLYAEMGQFSKALYYYEAGMNTEKKANNSESDNATSLNNIAFLYNQMGDFKKSEEFYIMALAARKQNRENSTMYAQSLSNLGAFYNSFGSYDKAESYLLQALALYKDLTGVFTENYRSVLANLASFHNNNGEYEKGLGEANEALKIAEELFGVNSLQYAETIEIKASILLSLSQIKEAEVSYLSAVKIRKDILGVQHHVYADLITTLGEFYRKTDQFELAKPLYLEAIAVYEKTFGVNSTQYATVLSDLGILNNSLGKFELAENYYLQAKEIWRIKKGEHSLDYARILNNIAAFYDDLGQYEKAIVLYEQCASIRKQLLGESHVEYGDVLNNLSVTNSSAGEIDKAEALQLKAIEIAKKTTGTSSVTYALRLSNLAAIYLRKNKVTEAEASYKEALVIYLNKYGVNNNHYASTLNSLGVLYVESKRFPEAMDAYLKAKAIRAKILGTKHQDYANVLQNLYRLAIKSDDFVAAESYINQIGEITLANLSQTFIVLSEKEKGNFLNRNISLLEDINSLLYQYPNASSTTKKLSFNLLLKLKSLTLAETKNVFDRVKQSTDTAVVKLYKNWLADKTYLSVQYNLDKIKQDPNLKAVEERTENLEKELTRKSTSFNNDQHALQVNYKDVQKRLTKDEAAIEFVSFNYYNKNWTDSVIYAAYLIRATDSVPQFVPLCEAKKLDRLFEVAGKTATIIVNSFYRGTKVTNTNKNLLSDSLYNLIWKPLESYLKDIKKIAYSPAGKLYAIAFSALQNSSKKLLIDKYQLQQYTSTRDLVFRNNEPVVVSLNSIALFGDAKFSMDSAALNATSTNKKITASYSPQINKGGSNTSWSALPGTLKEVNDIKKLFQQNKLNASIYTQVDASEQNFKALSNHSPQILHIATHGFFLPDPALKKDTLNQSNYELAKDPLLRSGLVLSGANYAWGGGKQLVGKEDGILTAYEISQLDLGQTNLIVLSACETALGDVIGSEGVFGLQRSFKMAGVKNMIVSLWQVPDKETAELMKSFYSHVLKGNAMEEAFEMAQLEMRKKYEPFYWAAFVLIK